MDAYESSNGGTSTTGYEDCTDEGKLKGTRDKVMKDGLRI